MNSFLAGSLVLRKTRLGLALKGRVSMFLLVMLTCMFVIANASAHLAGRLGVDNYVCISPAENGLEVIHDVHLGEIPAAALMARLDKNRDGEVGSVEMEPYFRKAAMVYADGFDITVSTVANKTNLNLRLPEGSLGKNLNARNVEGDDGALTFRYTWNFRADWPDFIKKAKGFKLALSRASSGVREASWQFAYDEADSELHVLRSNIPDAQTRPLPPDITETIVDSEKLPADRFAELVLTKDVSTGSEYAAENLGNLQENRTLNGDGGAEGAPRSLGSEVALRKRIMEMARSAEGRGTYAVLILLCFAWGAMHAFAPGHGKVIASTYLISAKASYVHAAILGLLMTMTHTAVILILAAAATVLKDKFVYPTWLQTVGAVLILLVGARQIFAGLRNSLGISSGHHHHSHLGHTHTHDHPHTHDHSHHGHSASSAVTAKDIAALGLSGGMVPCPAAIVLLLLTWQLGKPGFGFILIIAFSVGLASALIGVGFLAIAGTKFILRWISKPDTESDHHAIITNVVPIIGGILMLIFGTIILIG